MKKNYIQPQTEALNIQSTQMLCSSAPDIFGGGGTDPNAVIIY